MAVIGETLRRERPSTSCWFFSLFSVYAPRVDFARDKPAPRDQPILSTSSPNWYRPGNNLNLPLLLSSPRLRAFLFTNGRFVRCTIHFCHNWDVQFQGEISLTTFLIFGNTFEEKKIREVEKLKLRGNFSLLHKNTFWDWNSQEIVLRRFDRSFRRVENKSRVDQSVHSRINIFSLSLFSRKREREYI